MSSPPPSGNADQRAEQPGTVGALVARASRGDEDAWAELVALYARRVYALARSRRFSPDDAEEITQSVFVTIASKLRSADYDERGSFEPWLFQIAANRVRDAARKAKRAGVAMDRVRDSGDAPGRASRSEPASPDEHSALRDAIDALSDADRDVIELRHHCGMSFKTIAATLGEPLGTVLARHHRALAKLRDALTTTETPHALGGDHV